MYGLVNKAIEGLISQEHGEDAWERVLDHAGLESAGFVSMDQYADSLTYSLVGAASEVLEVPPADLLEMFGRFWVRFTAREGYGELLELSGRNFGEFLENLDNMHTRVGLAFPDLKPPSFRSEAMGERGYRLHYFSEREGLEPMVVGLVKGLADKFGLAVSVVHEVERGPESDHDVFVIEVQN